MSARERRLGRGLDALLGQPAAARDRGALLVPIVHVAPGPFQPRRRFDEAELDSLAESIRRRGVVQPILVRPHPNEESRFEIVAGERRWRAAQRAQQHEIPVVVKALDDREAMEIALIENIQRENLGPLEEAEGYRRLIDEFGGTQETLAGVVGKSRSHVANTLRLLGLPEPVRALLDDGALTAGHARALLAAREAADIVGLARKVVSGGLNVRQTERLARRASDAAAASARRPGKSADVAKLEEELGAALGLAVAIHNAGESGQVRIAYRSLEQLDFVIGRLRGDPAAAFDGGGEETARMDGDRAERQRRM